MTSVQLEPPFPPPAVDKIDLYKFLYGGEVSDAPPPAIVDWVRFRRRSLSELLAPRFHEASVVGHCAAFIIQDDVTPDPVRWERRLTASGPVDIVSVRAEGLEPPRREAAGPKPAVSTSSTTPAPAQEPLAPPSGDDNGPESVPKTVPTVPVECPGDDIDWWYYAV